jgi:hypothetical protein
MCRYQTHDRRMRLLSVRLNFEFLWQKQKQSNYNQVSLQMKKKFCLRARVSVCEFCVCVCCEDQSVDCSELKASSTNQFPNGKAK